MVRLRVYELARDLNMKTGELLAKMEEMNIPARSHASLLDKETASSVRSYLSPRIVIKNIGMTNFTVFENETLMLSDGLNIVIGENGAGKSHLLRLLYSLIRCNNEVARNDVGKTRHSLRSAIPEKLLKIFRPDKLNHLIRQGKDMSEIGIDLEKYFIKFRFTKNTRVEVGMNKDDVPKQLSEKKSVFIPEKETLSFHEGFTALYNRREVSFDETYYDLAEALNLSALKNIDAYPEEKKISDMLENILDGQILLERGKFYLAHNAKKKTEITLIAEGLRKIGTISRLLANGSLNKNSILFWDEPDSGLNPSLIRKIAKALLDLSSAGMQVFMTTHNLFMVREMEILKDKKDKVRYFGLGFDDQNHLRISQSDNIEDLADLVLLDEDLEQNDRFLKKDNHRAPERYSSYHFSS